MMKAGGNKKDKKNKNDKTFAFFVLLLFWLPPLPSSAESSGEMSPDISGLRGN
jgi:hypothetical protein